MIIWFYDLLALSLSVTPIIILLLWLHPLLKVKYSAKWRYILWIAISVRLLFPFSFASHLAIPIKLPDAVISGLTYSAPIKEPLLNLDQVNMPEVAFSFREILFIIYIIGAIIYLAYEIFSYIAFYHNVLRWSRKISNDELVTILKKEKQRLDIKQNVALIISKKVSSPMLLGLFKPTLILPVGIYSTDELIMILTHELVHLKRHDIWYKTILMFTGAVHWFNPFVYFMIRQANKDMEQSCDDYVLKDATVELRKFYCSIILKMANFNNNTLCTVFSTNIISDKENLESRIKDIFDNSKKRTGMLTLITIISLMLISSSIIIVSGSEYFENYHTQNEYLNKLIEDKNENINKIETNVENEIISVQNDKVDFNENKKPKKVNGESTSNNIQVINDNPSKLESSKQNSSVKQEEITLQNNNRTEIVIVDLNQLEHQLDKKIN